jgi:chromate reductase
MKNILLISGSLRKKSTNTALLCAFETEIGARASVSWADIQLPLFNEELEADFPAGAEALRTLITQADAIIISTPEYNRAMSGALKNAIDWASRPYGENAWTGKRILVTSASPGGIAGAVANYQVKQSLLHLGAEVLGQPEFMVGGAFDKFSDTGELTDEPTKEHIATAVKTLLGE